MHSSSLVSAPFLIIISSPSGAGKSTICKRILAENSNIKLSTSLTTRLPRPGEVDGVDYFFTTEEDFEKRIKEEGYFLEWARVFDNYYGTPHVFIKNSLQKNKIVLFDIDSQGAKTIREDTDYDNISIFILPPSLDVLRDRILGRQKGQTDNLELRLATVARQVESYHEYDYVIINDSIDKAVKEIQAILLAEQIKRQVKKGIKKFIDKNFTNV
jgi:guanylate kinase